MTGPPPAAGGGRRAGPLPRLRRSVEAAIASPVMRLVGGIACLLLFALLLLHLRNLWRENPVDLDDASPALLALAFLLTMGSAVLMLVPWADDMRALGQEPPRGLLSASLVGQLAKYLPGGVWPLLGRMGLANRLGVPLRTGGAALAMESILTLCAVGVFAPLVLTGTSLPAALPYLACLLLLAAGVLAGRSARVTGAFRRLLARAAGGPAPAIRLRPVRRAMGYYLVAWAITGAAFWLTAAAFFDTSVSELPLYGGAFAVAWAVGYLIIFAPGGLGVREVVLVALLRPSIGEAEALLLAATSRIAFTVSDLVTALVALPVLRHRLRRSGPGSATDVTDP